MANTDNPNGFRPVGTLSGAPWEGHIRHYRASGSLTDIFPGDMVTLTADGTVDAADAAEEEIIGACVGFSPAQAGSTNGVTDHYISGTTPNLNKTYYDASVDGAAWVMVAVGPDVLYEVQTDGTITYTDVGNNCEITATAGDATKGISQQEISSTTGTAVAQIRIVAPVNRVDNDVSSANSRWIVRINENHYNRVGMVGI